MIDIKQGDCLELMNNIPDHSIDMICCDLPYAITGKHWDVLISFDSLWEHYKCIIKQGGG
jgi:site-specific DNA-methyltransferase (adenine-specific)